MAIVYLEHEKHLLVKVVFNITDLSGDNSVFFKTAKTPPSYEALSHLKKGTLLKLIEPWHSGYSVSTQTLPFLRDYIVKHWAVILKAHVRSVIRLRPADQKLRSAYDYGDDITAVVEDEESECEDEEGEEEEEQEDDEEEEDEEDSN